MEAPARFAGARRMTMSRSMRFAAAALVAAFLAVVPAAAGGFGPHGPEAILRLSEAVGLSEEQTSEIRAILGRYREDPLGETLRLLREARRVLRGTIRDPQTSDDAVVQAAATVAALESQAAVERHHLAIEISKVLTPEQREKLGEISREKRRAGWPGRFRHGRGEL
jgi:Spy/CpxP family protein refolding chaperone